LSVPPSLRPSVPLSLSIPPSLRLNVGLILEGAVQCAGDRIRVTAQLVSVASDAPPGAEKFDERLTDIFAVEDEISERVAQSLTLRLMDEERKCLNGRGVENAEAHQLYLRALEITHTSTLQSDPTSTP